MFRRVDNDLPNLAVVVDVDKSHLSCLYSDLSRHLRLLFYENNIDFQSYRGLNFDIIKCKQASYCETP